jgi:hypothetical protein
MKSPAACTTWTNSLSVLPLWSNTSATDNGWTIVENTVMSRRLPSS